MIINVQRLTEDNAYKQLLQTGTLCLQMPNNQGDVVYSLLFSDGLYRLYRFNLGQDGRWRRRDEVQHTNLIQITEYCLQKLMQCL